ncbi:Uncharacterized protein DUF2406 [Aspergillus sclerotialis]|uniref:Uncharacterized protein DUF2406 n=1 Tax=Aspergillus sclerotialis TaxID=2070753 RepID=A0A3A3ACB8_9EURO|nr:Uncharacterized protein DUF2406 [Aspergillus sclerotialis]
MGSSRSSSERTGSIGSHPEQQHQKKPSLHTKNDPNLALREEQPMDVGGPIGFSLSSRQHTDINGQLITEPDLANPTRHRFERPLDTIRSFETAIRRNHKQFAGP